MKGWSWKHFWNYLPNAYLLEGAWTSIWLTVISILIGLVFGLVAALMLMSKSRIVRGLAKLYTWFYRGTPLLVQLIIIYVGLPQVGIKLSVIQSAIIGLSVNEGAYLAEIVRGGIMAVGRGQFDAAMALGMNYPTMMRVIILPQAARVIIPALGNRINGMLKYTSVTSVISMEELTRRSQLLIQEKFAVLEIYIVATIWYLCMTSVWNVVQGRIERHYGRAYQETRVGTEAR
ncbi:MAG: amino acid ABC transporter permease [Anaerolineae bacterium]|nr:amino acid ABC transporter permease [Anaerolineae bacterium]